MILQSLTVRGFKSIGEEIKIEFPQEGRIAIIGHNESGKTTLLEALWFAIYGLPRGKGLDREDIITWGKEAAALKAKFIIGKNTFEIQRTITRSGTHEAKLRWTSPEGEKMIDSIESIEEIIEQASGMDRKSFAELIYVRQKELDVLKGLAKADRELMINKVMGIDIFDKAVAKAKEDEKTSRDELLSAKRQLENLENAKNTYRAKILRKKEIVEVDYPKLKNLKAATKLRFDETEQLLNAQRNLKEARARDAVSESKSRELALLVNNRRLLTVFLAGCIVGLFAAAALTIITVLSVIAVPVLFALAIYSYRKLGNTTRVMEPLRTQLGDFSVGRNRNADFSEDKLSALESQIKTIQTELNTVEGNIRAFDGELTSIDDDLKRLGNAEEEYNKQKLLVERSTARIDLLERVESELKQTALHVRKQVFPHARLVINRILPQITSGHYVDMQITEDFHFKTYSTEANDYKESAMFSGGTQDQFLIALRLAFTQTILESRVRASRYALFMDECISSSDDLRRQGIFDMLDTMKNIFPQIFIIAHEDISEFVEHHLILSKDAKAFTKIRKVSWSM